MGLAFLRTSLVILIAMLISGAVDGDMTLDEVGTEGGTKAKVPFKVSCVVRSDLSHGPDLVEVGQGDRFVTMYPQSDIVNWSEGVRYIATLLIEEPGNWTLTFRMRWGDRNLSYDHDLIVQGEKPKERNDTFLGLPRWYCALSVVFLTILVMFLTFAYYKGRSLQKERRGHDGPGYEFCSSCGGRTSPSDKKCPSCGLELVENISLCGSCRAKVREDARTCPKCGVRLSRSGR